MDTGWRPAMAGVIGLPSIGFSPVLAGVALDAFAARITMI
jgi:hypothetical protein